ncbi:MAG: hypothetical protein B6229_05735 [Spirochaetaceae bacterium 4572_7]|nr:MAG: hypothetical protein B6229_05735 [Spirochaetaceae bacterium 4572_7]
MSDVGAISVNLAKYIKQKRAEINMTQEQLASVAQIDYKHIQNLESFKKKNDPKISTIIKLSKALNIPVIDMIQAILNS